MREIKFRAWDKDNDVMYESEEYGSMNDGNDCVHNIISFRLPRYQHRFNHVLMQFTGLKDKNGKDIYEGDIVVLTKDGRKFYEQQNYKVLDYYVVEYDQMNPEFLLYREVEGRFLHAYQQYWDLYEVIGNVWENKELLK